MLKRVMLTAAVVLAGAAAPAYAATTAPTPQIIFTDGNYALPSYTTATRFQSFESQPADGTFTPGPNESFIGNVMVRQNTIPGQTVDPDSNPSNHYLSIENGSYTVNLASPVQFFSFVLGSLDSYNSLVLNFANGSSSTFTGREIIGEASPGGFNSGTSGRVSFDLGGQSGITSAKFSSTQQAFEIDSLAAAVPEPATYGLMVLGFGAIGFAMRRKLRQSDVRFNAKIKRIEAGELA